MPDTPTFGRYAEIPHDQMTPEQQEGYRSLIETRGQLGGPGQDLGAQSQAGEGSRTARRAFSPRRVLALGARARDRRLLINTKWHSAYPTNAHERRGKEVGLPADKVEALISGLPTSLTDPASRSSMRSR